MLPQEAIQEFKELYEKRYGVKLSDEEASLRANNLFKLYKITYMGEPSIDDFKDKVVTSHDLQPNHNQ
ncbi:MAG: hypothetical protein PHV78_02455 [Patescibacteria group bacterium]|nr:hypothetical protein [Patescibacteria group bacterium]MDD5120994.1 hypothetical protein [Patescibacteria group bacterium]MDD5222255.1 hypothetical protein [Patescibacteria group bacterium]MDD5396087.1 hypothetical protein [Patescibacteria group bacterium]NMB48007.1 hypothetical protein [Candidatus Kuenenbacteria bacterium]